VAYNIGDRVWYAGREGIEERVICPECFGKKYLTVILGDDSKVTIDCAGCGGGYQPPKGYVTYYEQSVKVEEVIIYKVEIESNSVRYGFNKFDGRHYIVDDTEIRSTKKMAEIRAKELAEEWNEKELARIHQKKKNNHTWSWHVHYYRRQIREAERTIEYAKARLDAAKAHVKSEG